MKYTNRLALLALLLASPAFAGGSTAPGVVQTGAVTASHCAQFSASGVLVDSGAGCGSGTAGVAQSTGTGSQVLVNGDTSAHTGATTYSLPAAVVLGTPGSAAGSISLAGATTGTVVIAAPATGGGNATMFPGNDTVAGLAATQTFTNKSIDAGQLTGTIAVARLPLATTGAFGAVKCDGTTITCTGGVIASISGGTVSSVFGRTGTVVAATNDYNFNQLAGSAAISTQVSGLGSGVATALAIAHDTTGGVCTVGGGGCAGSGGYPALTSSTPGISITGSGTSAITVDFALAIITDSTSTRAITASDKGYTIDRTYVSADFSDTLVNAGTFGSGQLTYCAGPVSNAKNGTIAVTSPSSIMGGGKFTASLIVMANTCVIIKSDGSNFSVVGTTVPRVGTTFITNSTASTLLQVDSSNLLASTNTLPAGVSVANANLANSAITIGGASTSLGGSVTASTILDSIASTRGGVLYRGASGWSLLVPGTSGQFLQTTGAGADPVWATPSGSGVGCVPGGSATQLLSDNGLGACTSNTGLTYSSGTLGVGTATSLQGIINISGATSGTVSVKVQAAAGTYNFNLPTTVGSSGNVLTSGGGSGAPMTWSTPITSVGVSFTGGLVSVGSSPLTANGTIALTVAGTSGGIPYFSSTSAWASSAALTANLPVFGGGAGSAPFSGTRSGNTTQVVTTTGSQTSGNCVSIDASGNHNAAGFSCPAPYAVYVSGNYYAPFLANATAAASANSATVIRYTPIYISSPVTWQKVCIWQVTAGTTNTQIGVYANSASNKPTGAVLANTASFANTGANALVCATISLAITTPGVYWEAVQQGDGTATMNGLSAANGVSSTLALVGAASSGDIWQSGTTMNPIWQTSGNTFGTWPTSPTVTESSSSLVVSPAVVFQVL